MVLRTRAEASGRVPASSARTPTSKILGTRLPLGRDGLGAREALAGRGVVTYWDEVDGRAEQPVAVADAAHEMTAVSGRFSRRSTSSVPQSGQVGRVMNTFSFGAGWTDMRGSDQHQGTLPNPHHGRAAWAPARSSHHRLVSRVRGHSVHDAPLPRQRNQIPVRRAAPADLAAGVDARLVSHLDPVEEASRPTTRSRNGLLADGIHGRGLKQRLPGAGQAARRVEQLELHGAAGRRSRAMGRG